MNKVHNYPVVPEANTIYLNYPENTMEELKLITFDSGCPLTDSSCVLVPKEEDGSIC